MNGPQKALQTLGILYKSVILVVYQSEFSVA